MTQLRKPATSIIRKTASLTVFTLLHHWSCNFFFSLALCDLATIYLWLSQKAEKGKWAIWSLFTHETVTLLLQLYDKKRLLSIFTTIKDYILKLFSFDGSMALFFNLHYPGNWKYIKSSDNMKTTKVLEVSHETLEVCSIFYPKNPISEYLFSL